MSDDETARKHEAAYEIFRREKFIENVNEAIRGFDDPWRKVSPQETFDAIRFATANLKDDELSKIVDKLLDWADARREFMLGELVRSDIERYVDGGVLFSEKLPGPYLYVYERGDFTGHVYKGGPVVNNGRKSDKTASGKFGWSVSEKGRGITLTGSAESLADAIERVEMYVDEKHAPTPHFRMEIHCTLQKDDGERIFKDLQEAIKRRPKTCGAFINVRRKGYSVDGEEAEKRIEEKPEQKPDYGHHGEVLWSQQIPKDIEDGCMEGLPTDLVFTLGAEWLKFCDRLSHMSPFKMIIHNENLKMLSDEAHQWGRAVTIASVRGAYTWVWIGPRSDGWPTPIVKMRDALNQHNEPVTSVDDFNA